MLQSQQPACWHARGMIDRVLFPHPQVWLPLPQAENRCVTVTFQVLGELPGRVRGVGIRT